MTDSKKTLLFIPDISGFTEFVNTTEIDHSRHIFSIFTFEKQSNNTMVKVEIDLKIKPLFGRLVKPFVRKMLLSQNEKSLIKLQKVSEDNVS